METLTKAEQLEIYTMAGATEKEWIELRVMLEIRDQIDSVATQIKVLRKQYQDNN